MKSCYRLYAVLVTAAALTAPMAEPIPAGPPHDMPDLYLHDHQPRGGIGRAPARIPRIVVESTGGHQVDIECRTDNGDPEFENYYRPGAHYYG